jgi:Family of unknown function (DUF6152)
MNLRLASLSAITAAFAAPAAAHHSFAMFDAAKTVTVQGTVTEFEWVNPHSWLRIMVNDGKTGKPVPWTLELSSPSLLNTMGLQANSLKPGDRVSVTFHPMRDGSRGGQALQVVVTSGQH